MNIKHLHERGKAFAASTTGKRLIRAARAAFVALIVGVLIYQLSEIGWGRILSSLPNQPAFYALVLALYFLLPATEALIYGRLWSLRPLRCLGIMIRKRVLNVDVVGYSGEVYLFLWARDRVAQAPQAVMGTIKDNLIVSSVSSLLAASLLIGGLLATGRIALHEFVDVPSPYYVGLGGLAVVFLSVVIYRFRRIIFSLPRRVLPVLAAAHVSRFWIGYVLQVAAWWIVVPTASFEAWAILLVAFVVINRIPFLPSSDLVFVSAGAGLTPLLDIPVAPVVGMLLVRSAADRLLNLLLFTSSVWLERQRVSIEEDGKDELSVERTAGSLARAEKAPQALKT